MRASGAAGSELGDHFARLAETAGLIGTDAENLRAAIEDAAYASEIMHPSFAEHAGAAGDTAAVEVFAGARRGTDVHMQLLREALGDSG